MDPKQKNTLICTVGISLFTNIKRLYKFSDLDKFASDKHLEKLMPAIESLRKKKVETMINNPCLEIWFLIHFRNTAERV